LGQSLEITGTRKHYEKRRQFSLYEKTVISNEIMDGKNLGNNVAYCFYPAVFLTAFSYISPKLLTQWNIQSKNRGIARKQKTGTTDSAEYSCYGA